MDVNVPAVKGRATGEIAAWAQLYVVRGRRRWWGEAELLVRDPDGNETWITAGDTVDVNIRIKVGP